jgi:uncharacterized protein YjbI with pentapeptide repeats
MSRPEAPCLAGADLTGALVLVRLARTDLRGAVLAQVNMGVNPGALYPFAGNDLSGADLSGADLSRADLQDVRLPFAMLAGATLRGADLRRVDLSYADLTGADLEGADLSGADLDGTVLHGVRGLASVVGLERARNLGKAVRD